MPNPAATAGFDEMRRRLPDLSKIRALIESEPNVPLDQTLDDVIAQFR